MTKRVHLSGAAKRKIRQERGLPAYGEREKAYNRARSKHRERRLSEFITEAKTARGCTDCGYCANPLALQFDHLPEHEKLFDIGGKTRYSKAYIQAEIDKCEVVCANCHAIRTHGRRQKAPVRAATQVTGAF